MSETLSLLFMAALLQAQPPASAEAAMLAGMCAPDGADASRAIGKLDDIPRVSGATEEAVVTAIRERSPRCQAWAAVALGRIRPMRAAPALPLLREALTGKDPMLAFEAATTLGRMGWVARPALGDLDGVARAGPEHLRGAAASAIDRIRERVGLDRRPFTGLKLMALGRRDDVPVAYLVDEDGFVFEVKGGETLLDGRIERVSPAAAEFEGQRVTDDFAVAPHRVRLTLFDRGAPPPIPVVASEHTGRPVTIDFAGDLGTFAAFVATYAPLNVIVEAGESPALRVAARETPWDAVVKHALKEGGVAHQIESSYLRVGAASQIARHPRLPTRDYKGAPVTMHFRGVEMPSLARVFEHVSGLKIEVPPGRHEPLTLYFTDVPWDEAFEMIAATRGWTTRREGERLVAKRAGGS